jgi:CDP-diacylglycerol--serine O-phosphatidyltransferase
MTDLFPPFAPDEKEARRRRFQDVPFRIIAPNLVTLLAICLGLTAMRLVTEGKLEIAVYCILAAAALDGVDGRLARFLKGTSRFGEQLDSLADFVNFGVAPGFILWHFVLKDAKNFGWIAALIFAIAMCLRLARFNVMIDDPNRPAWKKAFFTGVPAPAGAGLVMLPLYLHFLGVPVASADTGFVLAPLIAVYVIGIAFLLVSSLPIFSGKTTGVAIPRERVLPLFAGAVAVVGLLVAYPFETLSVLVLAYFAMIPVSIRSYRARERQESMAAAAASAEAKAAAHRAADETATDGG